MRQCWLSGALSMALGLAWACPARASIVVIDNFSSGSIAITIPTDPDPSTDTDLAAGIIGGERELVLDQMSSTGLASAFLNQGFQVAGVVSLENGSGSSSVATLTYDGVGSAGLDDGVGGLGYDLTGMGMNTALFLGLISNDNGVGFQFTLTDADGTVSTVTQTFLSNNVGPQSFLFSSFAAALDFTAIRIIQLAVTMPTDGDVSFNLLDARSSVPEPTSLMLLGFGVFSLVTGGFVRRNRQRAA
jgi:hypothetical protein